MRGVAADARADLGPHAIRLGEQFGARNHEIPAARRAALHLVRDAA
jgi:hypothetical protein